MNLRTTHGGVSHGAQGPNLAPPVLRWSHSAEDGFQALRVGKTWNEGL